MQHLALDCAAVADRALVEAAGHPRISHDPARAHRIGKGGMTRDPVVDGARRHLEMFGQLGIGGAKQAIVVSELAELTAEGSWTSDGRHNSI